MSHSPNRVGEEIVVGLISDTHGLLRPDALGALSGVDLIIHAGDSGRADILEASQLLAPTCAVRGNVDKGVWADKLPRGEWVEVEKSASTSFTVMKNSISILWQLAVK